MYYLFKLGPVPLSQGTTQVQVYKIGRASCRERV